VDAHADAVAQSQVLGGVDFAGGFAVAGGLCGRINGNAGVPFGGEEVVVGELLGAVGQSAGKVGLP
jgi:hypothetical protein